MADPVKLGPPTLELNRIGPVEVPPAKPAVESTPLADPNPQFARQTRAPFLQRYIEDNTAGAPLDMTSGLPLRDRFQLARHRTEEDQKRYLESRYPDGVRRASDGQWIVRTPGQNGAVDILADPIGVDAGDWAQLAASLPQVAGAAALQWYTRGLLGGSGKVLQGARNIAASTIGAQATGAIEDLANRFTEGAPVNVDEIARSRAGLGFTDALIGTAIGSGLGIARFLKNPWIRNRTDIQINAVKAQREIADKYGIDIALTPAESTGSHMLTVEQARLEQVPGAAPVIRKFRANEQTGPMQLLQEVMLGGRPPEADVLGRQAITALQRFTGASDAAVDAARINLSRTALTELESTAATQSLADRNIEQVFAGDALRNRLSALRDQEKSYSAGLYDNVKKLGGDQPIFDGAPLAQRMTDLRKEFPPSFNPSTGGSTGPSTAFVPGGIRSMVDELEAGAHSRWRLSDLQQMRRRVYDDIVKGQALPDYDAHYLGKIADALTATIEEGVSKLPTSDLKDALIAANTHYRERVVPFGKNGIAEMFATDSDKNYIGSAQLADSYTKGPAAADKWRTLKEFIGSDSFEGRALKRQVFDSVLGDSTDATTGLLKGQRLMDRLAAFRTDSPDLYKEVFGKSGDELQRIAKFAIAGEKDVLPAAEIETMLRSGKGVTVTALRALKDAEEGQATLYRNTILEGIKAGKWGASEIKPDEFVARFMSSASKPEVEQVLALLKDRPALVQDIRASALESLLAKHAGKESIADAITEARRDAPMRALLGEDLFKDITRYGALDKAIITTREASIAGAFEKTSTINLLLGLPLRFARKVVGNKITAHVITSDTLRNWTLHQPASSEAVTTLMLSSPEFLQGIMSSFGNDSEGFRRAESFMGAAKRGLSESWSQSQGQPAVQPSTNQSLRLPPPKLMLRD